MDKWMWIVAGPPGAGKSGLAARLAPDWIGTSRYINADDVKGFADEIDDLEPELHKHVIPVSKRLEVAELAKRSFMVETRLVSRKPLSAALKLRRRGWNVAFVYLALPRIDLCRERVRLRVSNGGEDVNPSVMERAFTASLKNLPRYIDAAERWLILDSSGARAPRIARGRYASSVISQEDAVNALLPDYPFLPANRVDRDDTWADPVEEEFVRFSRWQSTVDNLLDVAKSIERRNA